MRQIELVKGIRSSVLGFGCAPILGSQDATSSRRALDGAFANGITHYDLARSYGYGEAEKFVGKHFREKRSQLVIASKFGIKANYKAKLLAPFKPVIRFGLRKLKPKHAEPKLLETESRIIKSTSPDRFHTRIPLNKQEMLQSLNESLKALGTDYLDYFFIHEPHHTIENIDELTACAQQLKQEGKIRAWGLAYMLSQRPLHQQYLHHFDILQFNNSPHINGYAELLQERSDAPNIFFSPLRGGNAQMKPAEKLLALSQDFTSSVILCSMFNEKHLQSNAALFH